MNLLHLNMFFQKSKPKIELFQRIIGLKPFTDYSKIDLDELQRFISQVKEKVCTENEMVLIKEQFLPSGAQMDDFVLQVLQIDKAANKILLESHKLLICENAPRLNIPTGVIYNEFIDKATLHSCFKQLSNQRIVPSYSSKFFTLETWSELSKRFIESNVSLGGDFEWWTACCDVYEQSENGELVVVVSSIERTEY